MRAREFIFEGFKEVEAKFIAAGADPEEVKEYLQQFRNLVKKNQFKDNERNIDWWGKNKSFQEFKSSLEQKSIGPTKSKLKRGGEVGRSINLWEDDKWLVVIPLDKDASCFHGKNSDWCTTKRDQQHFESYFYNEGITLTYCLNKETGAKWAIADHENADIGEPDEEDEEAWDEYQELKANDWCKFFDQKDTEISSRTFQQQTGLDPEDIVGMSREAADKIDIYHSERATKQKAVQQLLSQDVTKRDLEVERDIIDVGDVQDAYTYVSMLGINGMDVSTLPYKLQHLAAQRRNASSVVKWMSNPDPKIIQVSALHQSNTIHVLIDRKPFDPKLLLYVPPSKFSQPIFEILKNQNLLTPEIRQHVATDPYILSKMHKAGIEITADDVESSFVKNDRRIGADMLIYDLKAAISNYNVIPTERMMARAREVSGLTVDEIKKQLYTSVMQDINYYSSRVERNQSKIIDLQQMQAEAVKKIDEYSERYEELKSQTTFANREIDRLQYSISYYQSTIKDYQTRLAEIQQELINDSARVKRMNQNLNAINKKQYSVA